jgi:hypothetical protein
MTEIIHLTWDNSGTITARQLKKCASKLPPNVFKPGNLALAFPEPQTGLAFWIKDSKFLLRKMDIGQSADSYTDFDIHRLVNRLHSEAGEPIVLSNTPPPTENVFSELEALHRDVSPRPLVELPGSLRPIAELAGRAQDIAG